MEKNIDIIRNMTDDELRIQISLIRGMTWRDNGNGYRFLNFAGCNQDHGPAKETDPKCIDALAHVPMYAIDLNAMHEIEHDMRTKLGYWEEANKYLEALKLITGASVAPIFTTARQRAEAFVLVFGNES